jgi:2-oxoglutarate ferredoxin oxidoreductase subunit gamma
VIISSGKIGFPAVRKCDILVAMSQKALDKNLSDMKENGMLLVDSTVQNIPQTAVNVFKIPATEISEKEFGEKLYANMLMLGALTKRTRIVSGTALERAMRDTVSAKAVDANIEALNRGRELLGSS